MATKQEVQRAAVKRYGKRAGITWNKWASSPELRAKARTAHAETKQAYDAASKAWSDYSKAHPNIAKDLCKAARFVMDTDGDKTAIAMLGEALAEAESLERLRQEKSEAWAEHDRGKKMLRPYYFKYRCGTNDGLFFVVEHEAVTQSEMQQKIQKDKSRSGRQPVATA